MATIAARRDLQSGDCGILLSPGLLSMEFRKQAGFFRRNLTMKSPSR
jgi:hypothetical protein